ncbi:unnamed protein product [Rhizophagus irregularis]|nr:unnamed protein product [Rhizophagus irregularis]
MIGKYESTLIITYPKNKNAVQNQVTILKELHNCQNIINFMELLVMEINGTLLKLRILLIFAQGLSFQRSVEKLCGYCKIDQSCARKYRKSFSENSTIPEKFKYLSLNAVNHDPESRLKVTTIFEVLLNLLKDLHTHIRLQIHFINC